MVIYFIKCLKSKDIIDRRFYHMLRRRLHVDGSRDIAACVLVQVSVLYDTTLTQSLLTINIVN